MKVHLVPDTFWKSNNYLIITLFFICSLFSLPHYAYAQGKGAEVRLVEPSLPDARPGEIISVSFIVKNMSGRSETFEESLSLPEGWRTIIPPDILTLNNGEEAVRTMAFKVPPTAVGGQYNAIYSVRSKRDYAITDRADFSVTVLPVNMMRLFLESAPETIIEGEAYKITARLVNEGNSPITVAISARSTKGYPLSIADKELTLDPGAISPIVVSVETAPQSPESFKHVVILDITSKTEPQLKTSLSVLTEILSRQAKVDLYHRISTILTVRAMGERDKNNSNGYDVELDGKGTLDEEGRRCVEFLLRGPDTQENGLYGERDEYYMNYNDPNMNIRLGDQNYGLSYLTSYGRYGRGFEAKYHPEGRNLGVGAYYLKNRFGAPDWDEKGGYVNILSAKHVKLKFNYLTKKQDDYDLTKSTEDNIYSVEGEFEPVNNMRLLLEYAQGKRDKGLESLDGDAYRVVLYGSAGKVRYDFNNTHAEPDFYGYYNDSDYISSSLNFPLSSRMQAFLSHSSYETNLGMRPDKGDTANKEMLSQFGIRYNLSQGWYTQVGFDNFHKKDRFSPAEYDIKEKAYRLSIGRIAGNFSYRVEARYADQYEKVDDMDASPSNYSFLVTYMPSMTLYFTFYGGFGDNAALRGSRLLSDQDNLGISFNWQATDRLMVKGWYAKYNFNSKIPESDNYEFELRYMMSDESYWSLKARRYDDEYNEQAQTNYVFSYSMPISISVGKKKSLGFVSGMVVNAQTEANTPFSSAVVALNGNKVVTDKSGRFSFSAPPGTYILDIDRMSIGLKNTATIKLPIKVAVKSGEITHVELNIVESATLGGQVILTKSERGEQPGKDGPVVIGDPGKFPVEHERGLEGILVELSRDDEIIRMLTDSDGKFTFIGIRPGTWKFKAYDYKLPPYHYIETPEMDLTLSSGDMKNVNIKVLEKKRQIQMLEEGIIRNK